MFIKEIKTSDPEISLVKPDVERDAQLGVVWLNGPNGRQTLKLIGVAENDNVESNLEQEKSRVREFLTSQDQCNWMINVKGKVVGTVWANLKPTNHIGAPAVSFMIGDPNVRNLGVGKAAVGTVVSFLEGTAHPRVYARHLVSNLASRAMLARLKFIADGVPYSDEDGLEWQNLVYSKVLAGVDRFLDSYDRLANWPSKSADKLAVLEYLSTKFGFGHAPSL